MHSIPRGHRTWKARPLTERLRIDVFGPDHTQPDHPAAQTTPALLSRIDQVLAEGGAR